jgi:ribose 5-phosphate isomerase B
MLKKIVIGSDHGGFYLKDKIVSYLKQKSFDVDDVGTHSGESCDYPVFAHQVASKVGSEENCLGILICTTGQGMVITANKYKGVRAALCWDKELANLARAHNNSNILCLPANHISVERAIEIIDVFYSSQFEGDRHLRRVDMIEGD